MMKVVCSLVHGTPPLAAEYRLLDCVGESRVFGSLSVSDNIDDGGSTVVVAKKGWREVVCVLG